ncbi:glycerophosphodiester phosphodiesterase family protein [uncultured Gimesia sp.]|uniref:glycerophosphodiester phosphodiesterase n=1 Tax=uncultured Gimesia sp. TaxID=1678688 RepID=UPI0030D9DF8E|tara:strand:+ start:308965 stop:309789 length:825 start_codon:yes stop_codon:yes gene_type:complete
MKRLYDFLILVIAALSLQVNIHSTPAGQPLIVAHRGLLKVAPENTLSNFRACLELRLGFEFDVQRTKDDHLVCIHDSTVNRTTNGSGKVSDLTLAEVKQLDAGSWFGSPFAGEKVPTVEQVLQLAAGYKQHPILIAVDFKDENVEQDVVRLAKKHGILSRLIFIGRTIQDPKVRANIKATSPKAETAAVANNASEFPTSLADTSADWVYVRYIPSKAEMERVHQAGKRAFIAGPTVGGKMPENWQRAATVGIDAILTDYPLALRAVLKQNAVRD